MTNKSKPFVKRPAVHQPEIYGHAEDDTFETQCAAHAEAYAIVFDQIPFLRQELHNSGRFANDARLEGALQRHIQLLVDWETRRIKQAMQADSPAAMLPVYNVGAGRVPLTSVD